MRRFARLAAAILSGVLLALCYPPISAAWLVWLALVPLILALQPGVSGSQRPPRLRSEEGAGASEICNAGAHGRSTSRTLLAGLILGQLAGIVFFLINLKWLHHVTSIGTILLACYLGSYFALWGMLVATISRSRHTASRGADFRLIITGAAAWTGLEWLRGWIFTGFGWNGLGVALVDWPVAQTAEVIGVTGLSFFVAAVSLALARAAGAAIRERRWHVMLKSRELVVVIGLVVVLSAAGWWRGRTFQSAEAGGELKVALVQPNIPQAVKNDWEYLESIANTLSRLTDARLADGPVDLLVWPESVLPATFHDPFTKSFFDHVAGRGDFTLVTGIDEQEMTKYFNSVAVLRGDTSQAELHRKVQLVPFGEFLPLRPIFKHFDFVASQLPGDFDAGDSTVPIPLSGRGVSLIPLVCFEDTFGRLTRRFVRAEPQLLLNVTNDAWFEDSEGSEQHAVNARFRCIELRRPMARAANTGVTCVVDRCGRVTHHLPRLEEGVLSADILVPSSPTATVYGRVGDTFSIALLAVAVAGMMEGAIRRLVRPIRQA